MKGILRTVFAILLALALPPVLPAAAAENRPLADLVKQALTNNPDLQAARERWQMFEQKVLPARSLDDPRLGLAFSNYPVDSFQADRTPMTGNELQLSQGFPFPGKLGAKGEMAREQARWYQGAYEDARLQLAGKVKDAWYRLAFQDRAIAVTEQDLKLLDQFIRLAATRYAVGKGLQQDVLKAQLERSKLMDKLFSQRQQRRTVTAELNTLLGRDPATPFGPLPELTATTVTRDVQALQQLATDHRPLFRSYQSLIARYQSQRHLAKLSYYPDFNIWASYRFRDDNLPDGGTDFASAGVSITLPLWRDKRAAEVADADSGVRMAQRQFDDFRNQVHFAIEDGYARLAKDRDLLDLYGSGILPQAQQTYAASLSAYQVGSVDALNLIDSLLSLYRYQIEYQRVLADHERDVARLEAVTGVSLGEPSPEPTH
jgi:outer membrane protein, heavy metal efflux system